MSTLFIISNTIITTTCVLFSIISLSRLKTVEDKSENLLFFFLNISATGYSLIPFIYDFNIYFCWIISSIFASIALISLILLFNNKLLRTIVISASIFSLIASILLILFDDVFSLGFAVKYFILYYPMMIMLNIMLYANYAKHKTRLFLLIGILFSIVIASASYDLFKLSLHLPRMFGSLIGMSFYIIIVGYELIFNGYLTSHGWKDYSRELRQKENLIDEKFELVKKAKIDSVVILSQTIEAKDPYTRGHCLRVRDFAKAIAKEMSMGKEEIHMIEFGALLHDVGKIGIPGVILNKSSKLSENEYKLIKKHPEIGASIVKNVEYYAPIIPMIRHHHEHYNGTGYPDGLSYQKIPLEARILAVGDVFDALTSDRPYRRAMPSDQALTLMKKLSGNELDPEIVDIFMVSKIYDLKHVSQSDKLNFEF